MLAQSQLLRHQGAHDVGALRGDPEREEVLARVVAGDDAARLDRRGGDAGADHPLGDDDLRLREGVIDGAVIGPPSFGVDAGAAGHDGDGEVVGIAVVDQRRLAREGELRIDHGRQLFHLDIDRVDRVPRDVAVVGDDDRQRLTHVAHLVTGERQEVRRGIGGEDGHRREFAQVAGGEHCLHAGQGGRLGGIDGDDAAVRDIAAAEAEMQETGQLNVVDVGATALDQPLVFLAADALPNEAGRSRSCGQGVNPFAGGRRTARGNHGERSLARPGDGTVRPRPAP